MSEPLEPIGLANTAFYLRDPKRWAVEQEQYRHDQALYSLGELAMFVLMWRVEDYKNGYVRRCSRCYQNVDDTLARASKAYNQPTENRCPMCYGTTLEGGIRARIIRPCIFSDTDDRETPSTHGVVYPQSLTVETASDFRFRDGDYVFREDGSRWRLASPTRDTVRTGFDHPSQAQDSMGYATSTASLEDKTSVAWMISPSKDDLQTLLSGASQHPITQSDEINGPLIPLAWTD